MYAQFWRRKLLGDKAAPERSAGGNDVDLDIASLHLEDFEIDFPEKLCPAIAKITDKFSFAYMQEAFVAALLVIASEGKGKTALDDFVLVSNTEDKPDGDDDFDGSVLWRELKKQIKILREQLGELGGITQIW
jgi:hypothetical protein